MNGTDPSTRRQHPPVVELRSDTFTKPTPEMLRAMVEAEVGDDMVGEDPTVNALEARMAELFGKEAAVFACSGTQSNQMAVWMHCEPGDELLIEQSGHIANYEAGGPAVLRGVSVRAICGDGGMLSPELLAGQVRGRNQHLTPTRLLCLENTTNMGGGHAYPLDRIAAVSEWARSEHLRVHMDGARFFNAVTVQGYSPESVGRHVDSISICFSKGLGCPMGSVLVGSAEDIQKARKARKIFGGALRQAGVVAAAARYALGHHIERLAEDHANARLFAESIADLDAVEIDAASVESNLVFFDVVPSWGTASQLSTELRRRNVNINPSGPQRMRACTHLGVTRDDVLRAVEAIRDVTGEVPAGERAAELAYSGRTS